MILANIEAGLIMVSCFVSLASNINILLLERVPYIYNLVQFRKDQAEMQTLIDSKNEVNVMTPAYVFKLGLKV